MAIYMKLGGKYKGDVAADKWEDWILLSTYTIHTWREYKLVQGEEDNIEAGVAQVGDLLITKVVDGATGALSTMFYEAKVEDMLTVVVTQGAEEEEEEVTKIEMTNPMIKALGTSAGETGRPNEQISFGFTKIEWTDSTVTDKNKLGNNKKFGWDKTKNKKT